MVTLRADKDLAEKHIRDVDKREESLLKEKGEILVRCIEESAQKEEKVVKLNDQVMNL